MNELDEESLLKIANGEEGSSQGFDEDQLLAIANGETEKQAETPAEKPAERSVEFPEISPGITDYAKIGRIGAEVSKRMVDEEPKLKSSKVTRSSVNPGSMMSKTDETSDVVDSITIPGRRIEGPTLGEQLEADTELKRGDVFSVKDDNGKEHRFRFHGSTDDGAATLKRLEDDEEGESKASISKRVFQRMTHKGKFKLDSSAFEQVRLGLLAETGDVDRFTRDNAGRAEATAVRATPFVGRGIVAGGQFELQKLNEIANGDFNDSREISNVVKRFDGSFAKTADETEDGYKARVMGLARDELKKRVTAMREAGEELSITEKTTLDKIVGGFIESSGYAGEFAISSAVLGPLAGGMRVMNAGAQTSKIMTGVAKVMNGTVRSQAISAPVTVAEAFSRYTDNTTPGFGIDDDGNPYIRYEADSKGVAAWKAIGGAIYDTTAENSTADVALYVGRMAMKPAGWAFNRFTPGIVAKLEGNFNKFANSKIGVKARNFAHAYGEFSDLTKIHDPISELSEENVQAFEKVIGLDGKSSEYKGFAKEWEDFKDNQMSIKTQTDIFLGLIGQLAMGAAVSAYNGHQVDKAMENPHRDVMEFLRDSGVSEDSLNRLSDKQKFTLQHMYVKYSADPERLLAISEKLGMNMQSAVNDIVSQTGFRMCQTLEQRGIAPEEFRFQFTPPTVGEAPAPLFKQIQKTLPDGTVQTINAMRDDQHGVSIVDNGDGRFTVVNDQRGDAVIVDSIDDARVRANLYSVTNQRMNADNAMKRDYVENVIKPKYQGRNIHAVDSVEQLRQEVAYALSNGENYFGCSDASQIFDAKGDLLKSGASGFHTSDGTVVLILDNVSSPAYLEKTMRHEATGHEGLEKQVGKENIVTFVSSIESESFDAFQDGVRNRRMNQFLALGMSEEEANAATDAVLSTDEAKKEMMANYAMQRTHKATNRQRKQHEANQARRRNGEYVPVDDADLEVILENAEREGRSPSETAELTFGQNFTGFEEVQQEAAPAEAHAETGTNDLVETPENETSSEGDESATASAPVETATTSRPEKTTSADAEEASNAEASTDKPVEKSSVPEEKQSQTSIDNVETIEQPVDELTLSEDVPNFKEGANKEGVVEPLKASKYERRGTAPIVVWVRNDGRKEVITGRHRYELARRLGEKTIPAQLVYEKDGFTKETAATLDAESNIRDGQGSIKDYENYFRNSDITEDEASGRGLLSRDKGRKGFAIAKWASPDVLAAFHAGELTPEKAAAIATEGKDDESIQNIGLKFAKNHTVAETVSRMKNVKGLARDGLKGGSGAIQADLFMDTDFQRTADAIDAVSNQLEKAVNAELTALKGAKKLGTEQRKKILEKYGIKTGDTKAIENRIAELEKFKEDFGHRESNPAMMNLLRKKAGLEVKDGAEIAADPTGSNDIKLESASAEELKAEEQKRKQKKAIADKQNAPLKTGTGEVGQTLMDLGGAEGEDLFNRTQTADAIQFPERTTEAQKKVVNEAAKNHPGLAENLNDAWVSSGAVTDGQLIVEFTGTDGQKRVLRVKKDGYTDGVQSVPFFQGKKKPVVSKKETTTSMTLGEAKNVLGTGFFSPIKELKSELAKTPKAGAKKRSALEIAIAQAEKNAKSETEKPPLDREGVTPEQKKKALSEIFRGKKPRKSVKGLNLDEKTDKKATDALNDIDFMSEDFDGEDYHGYRSFDVRVGGKDYEGRIKGYTRKQASGYARKFIGKDAEVHEAGTLRKIRERDIIGRHGRLRRYVEERTAEWLGNRPSLIADALGRGAADTTSIEGLREILVKSNGGTEGGGLPKLESLVAQRSWSLGDGTRRFYSRGDVAIQICPATSPYRVESVKHALRKIIVLSMVTGNVNITSFAEDSAGSIYAVGKCEPFKKIPRPDEDTVDRILHYNYGLDRRPSRSNDGDDMFFVSGYNAPSAPSGSLLFGETASGDIVLVDGDFDIPRDEKVDFMSENFDYEKFGKLVTGVGKLVDTLSAAGHKDFASLARFIASKDAEKYERAKAVLQDVWNAVARQKGLARVSDETADGVYGTIDAELKGEEDGRDLGQPAGSDGNGNQPLGGVLPEKDNQAPQEEQARGGGAEGGEGNARAGASGKSGNARPTVGGREGAADSRAGGEGDDAGNGRRGGKAGGASGRAGGTSGREVSAGGRVSQPGQHDSSEGDSGRRTRVNNAVKAADSTKVTPPKHPDFVMTKAVEEAILEPNHVKRAKQNLAAIRLLNTLRKENRQATPAEQETLAKYVGWGGLSQFLDYAYDRAWRDEQNGRSPDYNIRQAKYGREGYEIYKEMRSLMSEKDLSAARESTLSAFYTPIQMVRVEHEALRALGVTGGRFLGPSAGVGNYASAQGEYAKNVRWQFVELDETTGNILKHLFPNQRVEVNGYEKTNLPDSFYDVAIDNVPYINFDVRTDKAIPSMKIHDYFFAKTLTKLRPGGVMMFLTSTGTLDKQSATLRKFLSDNGGQIVGAVRLPNRFFSKNAGTDVAADLVIVQKKDGAVDNSAFDGIVKVGTERVQKGRNIETVDAGYNKYFDANPDQVIGGTKVVNDMHGKQAVQYTMPDGDLYGQVREAIDRALQGVNKDALLKSATVAEVKDHTPIYDESGLRQGSVTEKDGKFFIKAGNELLPVALPCDAKNADGTDNKGYTKIVKELKKRGRDPKKLMQGIFRLRKAMRDVIDAEMRNCTDEELKPLLDELNRVYDGFVNKFGNLNDSVTQKFVLLDAADGNRMMALERKVHVRNELVDKDVIEKADIFSKRVIFTGETPTKADTPMDAMIISYSETGTLDIPRVAQLLGVSEDEAVERLKKDGNVFDNPQTGKLEPSWQYLSGRVRAKLAAARAAAEREPAYWDNVKALEKVIPADVALHDVTIPFGASWVDPEVMSDFMKDAFGSEYLDVKFRLIPQTGTWTIDTGRGNIDRMENPWGETTFAVEDFIDRVINNGTMNHYNSYPDPNDPGKTIREFDPEGTERNKLAKERLNRAFESFVQNSNKWHDGMERRYNDVMNDGVPVNLPAGVLPFDKAGMKHDSILKLFEADENGDPDMRKPKKGREYQSSVIATGVLGGQNLYLAHAVGAGKTMEMQSISMLGRHLGQFKKPIHVVPNHMLEQYCNEFLADFPDANILKMTDSDASPANRRKFFAMVANGDWDAIVVRRDTFAKKLPMSPEYLNAYYDKVINEWKEVIAVARQEAFERHERKKKPELKELEDAFKKVRERIDKKRQKLSEKKDRNIVPFEELGIDQIFVDEAHNFKGLPVATSQGRRIKGLQQGESSRAEDMEMKCDFVQSLRGGNRGVVFASGTSLSNAPVLEAYVILRFLAKERLEEQGLSKFDQFVKQFGETETVDRINEGGTGTKAAEEVTGLNNAPELMRLFKTIVNIVNSEDLDLPRPTRKLTPVQVQMTDAQKTVMHMIARECMVSGGKSDPGKGLSLANIAKSVCISPRLLGIDDDGNKLHDLAVRVHETWENTSDNNGTQLVFTDKYNLADESTIANMMRYLNEDERKKLKMSGAKSFDFNHAIVEALVAQGIPRNQIAVMQDLDKLPGDKDTNKAELFKKVKSGEVRVLIGSRPRMGEGTNVQDRLAAIHLVHPGWKPSEDEQAEGRIIRWGNQYKEGKIFYYLTQGDKEVGSYETANHELIGKKAALINKILRGDGTVRKVEMNSAEDERDLLMGLTISNPNLAELVKMRKPLQKLDLDVSDLMTQARRKKDAAGMMTRKLQETEREFAEEKKRINAWIEKQDGKPFAVDTEDGKHIEKLSELTEHINDRVRGELAKDSWQREDFTVGTVNGSPLEVRFGAYGEESFKLGLPELGVWKDVSFTGFEPNLTMQGLAAFVNRDVKGYATPDYIKAYEGRINDARAQIKKVEEQSKKFEADYKEKGKKLAEMKRRKLELERIVYPLIVKTTEMHGYSAYGNWAIVKQEAGGYAAQRIGADERLSANTVRELLPKIDEADMANPNAAVRDTVDLVKLLRGHDLEKFLRDNVMAGKGEVKNVAREDVNFMSEEFDAPMTEDEKSYTESKDKTPTEEVSRKVFGMTNDEIETEMKAAGLEPPKFMRKSHEKLMEQVAALVSNPSYMRKLAHAVARVNRPTSDYENVALNQYFRDCQARVNELNDEIKALGDESNLDDESKKLLKSTKAELRKALALMGEAGRAASNGASEQARALASNRILLDAEDYSYAGIAGAIQKATHMTRLPPELEEAAQKLAKEFADLDEEGRMMLTKRLKAYSEKVVEDLKNGEKKRKNSGLNPSGAAKKVLNNYLEALAQIEVHAKRGEVLVGLTDQMYPTWGRYLRAIGEYHVMENPDITEEGCIKAITEDVGQFIDGVTENDIRDALTGFGHNYRQSRRDTQRIMNDLRAQSLKKLQLKYMEERNALPPQTGMIRDEPSDETRRLTKEVSEKKKETPEGGENRLKGLLESAKTRVRNQIADLENAIATNTAIPHKERKAYDDVELNRDRVRLAKLKETYNLMFPKEKRVITDAERLAASEKSLEKVLEGLLGDLANAHAGDYRRLFERPKEDETTSAKKRLLRNQINAVRKELLEIKRAKYEYGMTPAEIESYLARKLKNIEETNERLAKRLQNGQVSQVKKPMPEFSDKADKEKYEKFVRKNRAAVAKLAHLREMAQNWTQPNAWNKAKSVVKTALAIQRLFLATLDMSAFGKQGARFYKAHPKLAKESFKNALGATKGDVEMEKIHEELLADPLVKEAVDKYGLHLRDNVTNEDVEVFKDLREISVFGKNVMDIPLLGAGMLKSERHYVTYLNTLSVAMYTSIVNDTNRFPHGATPWQKKMIADIVNMYNGSGAMSRQTRATTGKALGKILWAPGLLVSRLQFASGYDILHPLIGKNDIPNGKGDYDKPTWDERLTVARIALRDRIRSSAATVALGALTMVVNAMINNDDEWEKFKRSHLLMKLHMLMAPVLFNTTMDWSGGEALYVELLDYALTGERMTGTGKVRKMGEYGSSSFSDILLRKIVGYKASPFVGMALRWFDRQEIGGGEYGFRQATRDFLIPLVLQDAYEQIKENGLGAVITIPASVLGIAGSTYDRKAFENAVNSLTEEQQEEFGADIKSVRRQEARMKKLEKRSEDVSDMRDEIESTRSALLGKIRESR